MTGEPLFFGFFDTADNVAIGDGHIQFGKPLTFARLFKVLLNYLQMLLKSDDICSICEYIGIGRRIFNCLKDVIEN